MVVLPLMLLGSCGDDSIPLQDLDARITDAACRFEVRCGFFPDLATCLQSTHSDLAQITADVNAGKTRYDGKAAAACVDAVASFSCDQSAFADTQACDDTFKGTIAAGGACFGNEECTSLRCDQAACLSTATCCAGTCQVAQARVPEGGDCLPPNTVCVAGTFCQVAVGGRSAVCHAKLSAGQACQGFADCAPGLSCQQATAAAGVCVRSPATGEACDPLGSVPCASSADLCDQATSRCAPRAAIGHACPDAQACVVYASCDGTTFTCVPKKGLGAACADQVDCLSSLTCVSGTCAELPRAPVCP